MYSQQTVYNIVMACSTRRSTRISFRTYNNKYHSGIRGIYITIHLPRWFSPTKKPVLLLLQYHDYFYHSHSKRYHGSNCSIIFITTFHDKIPVVKRRVFTVAKTIVVCVIMVNIFTRGKNIYA